MRKKKSFSGKPLREDLLIVGAPQIVEEDLKELEKVFRSGWWVNGPYVKALEGEFKKYIGCKYAVAVGSGTFALHLALDVLGVGPGDEVITTPYTFPATAHAIEYVGAKPIFVDIEMGSYNMDPDKIERAISKKTKAIMPIHIAGRVSNMGRILRLARKYKLFIVEDAAHAVESSWKKKKVGTISDLTIFSFDVTKNVAGGIGGMVTTNKKKLFERLQCYAHFGFTQREYFLPYDTIYPGYKYDMSEFCAALALNSLKRVDKNLKTREKYWQMYDEAFKDVPEIVLPNVEDGSRHARHLYMVLLKFEKLHCKRDEFMKALTSLNIGSRIRFTAIHLHSYYRRKYGYHRGDFPVTEYVSDRVICLPFSARLKKKDVRDVIKSVKMVIDHYRK